MRPAIGSLGGTEWLTQWAFLVESQAMMVLELLVEGTRVRSSVVEPGGLERFPREPSRALGDRRSHSPIRRAVLSPLTRKCPLEGLSVRAGGLAAEGNYRLFGEAEFAPIGDCRLLSLREGSQIPP